MAKTYHLQLLRGDTAKASTYVGFEGELVVNRQLKNLWLHDGSTVGGIPVAMKSDIPTKVSQLENDANYASTAPGSESADSAVHDQLGNTIHLYYAPINSPVFTGTPTCPTPAPNDNSTTIVNSEWVAKATCVVHTVGNETVNGTKTFTNVINGTALRAQWADLAENYDSDQKYPPGTLVCFGGEKEITIATQYANAVVSENPAYLMNSNMHDGLPIALVGRVKVRVDQPVKKFDKLVLGPQPGIATVDNNASRPLGIVLESTNKVGLVLASVRFDF